MLKNLLFWQSNFDYLGFLQKYYIGRLLFVPLNYIIWIFFAYLSFLLVRYQSNIFAQLFFATLLSELIEKLLKSKQFWSRPMFIRHHSTPKGLVDKWYKTGSFPSGHTTKATFFYLLVVQYSIFSPYVFLAIVIPLIIFRILVGFHYPIDILGGLLIGGIIWLMVKDLAFPQVFNELVASFFNVF